MKVADTMLRDPLACQCLNGDALRIGFTDVVIRDNDDLTRIPDTRAERLELRLHTSWPAGVVHHGKIDPAGNDIAGSYTILTGGTGNNLFGER